MQSRRPMGRAGLKERGGVSKPFGGARSHGHPRQELHTCTKTAEQQDQVQKELPQSLTPRLAKAKMLIDAKFNKVAA